MPTFEHDGLRFRYHDRGAGLPFVFQHALGGESSQALAWYDPGPGVRLIGFDARAHGETRPLGDLKKVAIAPFADDLVALLDALAVDRAVVGGVSMGAAVALNAALRYPRRVLGLVLSHPAWIDRPLPENARAFSHVAQHLLKFGAEEGRARYLDSPEYRGILAECPATATMLLRQFEDPRAEECVVRLERIPHDSPCHDRDELAAVRVPTLVLGARHDPVHPWEFAQTLAGRIPGADLTELTPRGRSLEAHARETQAAIDGFLKRVKGSGNLLPESAPVDS